MLFHIVECLILAFVESTLSHEASQLLFHIPPSLLLLQREEENVCHYAHSIRKNPPVLQRSCEYLALSMATCDGLSLSQPQNKNAEMSCSVSFHHLMIIILNVHPRPGCFFFVWCVWVSRVLVSLQDTVIYDRLADSSRYKEITLKHLEQFATEGEWLNIAPW